MSSVEEMPNVIQFGRRTYYRFSLQGCNSNSAYVRCACILPYVYMLCNRLAGKIAAANCNPSNHQLFYSLANYYWPLVILTEV